MPVRSKNSNLLDALLFATDIDAASQSLLLSPTYFPSTALVSNVGYRRKSRSVHRENLLRLERKLAWFNAASQVRRGSA